MFIINCQVPPPVVTEIPTLSEWGLIAMSGILGIVGFIMVIRRRKVTA
ncbi:MAG: IPTL-CTERM sorting domain-containing protein [Deltaproteobacteria bacterium]|nr:IPTL-CTERM sorting domain-containing protein [Deltaproteobacteria bacterium]